MPTNIRRFGLAAAATSLALGTCVVTAGTANADASFDFTRIEGANRYLTSVNAAEAFGKADTVILASGESGRYPDALTANYLAGIKGAPVLLTRKDQTPEEVKKAISDAGAKTIIIVGGEDVVSKAQEDSLKGTYAVKRLAGDNRYATAAAVIAEGDTAPVSTALLATGRNFPDALGAGPVAFAEKMPLAITDTDDAPDNVVQALRDAGINKVLVLGGKTAVSEAVVNELKAKGISVEKRFDGADRAETSTLLAQHAVDNFGFSKTAVNVASGYNNGGGADALSGAPLTGKAERALLITRSNTTAGDSIVAYLKKHAATLTEGVIFGGDAALAKSVEYSLEKVVLGSGAQNTKTGELYDTVQAAVDEAQTGDTVTVFGADNAGFTVAKPITVVGEEGAKLTGGVTIRGVDGVTIADLTITPSNQGGEIAGVYLDNAEGVTIKDNVIAGTGKASGARGVINAVGGEKEIATISGNSISAVTTGVFSNPSAEFTVTGNEFRQNAAGVGTDEKAVIKNNRFVNNDEGIGLGAAGSTVEGNYFANQVDHHVKDWTTAPADKYDLAAMIQANTFDEPVVVNETNRTIVDQS